MGQWEPKEGLLSSPLTLTWSGWERSAEEVMLNVS